METRAQPPIDRRSLSRFVKILYWVMFATVGLYWYVLELLAPPTSPLGPLKTYIAITALATAGFVLYWRFARIAPLLSASGADPLSPSGAEMSARLTKLRSYYILCYTLSEAVALYGFVVRMFGGHRADALPFFAGAVTLFLLCYPRLPKS
ncbi:MAG: hypothetical protein ACE5HL_07290, partial [Terriglobia bacterium]